MSSDLKQDGRRDVRNDKDTTLECKQEAFKKIIFTCTKKFSSTKTYLARPSRNIVQRKTRLDSECHKAQNGLMSLVVVKDKGNYQKHEHEFKRLI